MKRTTVRTIVLCVLAVLWAGLIFGFSSQSGEASAAVSEDFMNPFSRILTAILGEAGHTFVRKCAHFFLYAVLMILTVGAYRSIGGRRPLLCPFAICVLYAVSDEIHQYFVPGRACRIYDVCVDALGCFAGAFLLWLVREAIGRIRVKRFITENRAARNNRFN
jgi:VanZ family protein